VGGATAGFFTLHYTEVMVIGKDALPVLDSPYRVDPEQLEDFRHCGWVKLKKLLSPDEVEGYGPAIQAAAMQHNRETRPLEERDTYGKAFLQVMNLWRVDPLVAQFTLSKRLAGVAAQLLGVKRVRLYHDQALFKEPGGGHTPWHQDGYFWPMDQSQTVTLWMPLVDVSEEMGSMSFADGSHADGLIPIGSGISDETEAFYAGYVAGRRFPVRTSGAMAAGDATFHSGLTLHRAPGNPTNRVRAVMTVIYIADGQRIREPQNPNQVNDLRTWFPNQVAGEVIDSEFNPLI
jgi:ectoine hydroxylase-related dioxygenase (phytanoyl-CoA dioxygenase family)